ncbi:hypothetical protein, partial [Nocardia sp. NPDC058497]|uniref:hypothetical protein n=1 Tax=Nocardia sp. NPDC058497 TaxID=3346529 RepID=UPI00364B4392
MFGSTLQRIDDRCNGRCQVLVLPNPDDAPASRAQRLVGRAVTFDGPLQLGPPIPLVGRRTSAVFRARVPETSIHEYRDRSCSENNNTATLFVTHKKTEIH